MTVQVRLIIVDITFKYVIVIHVYPSNNLVFPSATVVTEQLRFKLGARPAAHKCVLYSLFFDHNIPSSCS